jgi:(p)ppGpp synthase/HD superfamily hydrolase
VVNVLKAVGEEDQDVLAAAWCHDLLEDTALNYNDLKGVIGERASDIVYDVTNELGKNRKERAEKTYPKIAKNPLAIRVKLADRIANMEFSKQSGSGMFEKYCKESDSFHDALMKLTPLSDDVAWDLWWKLGEIVYGK